MKKIVLITACGNKKENRPMEAGKIYKSPRIRYLYRKSKELNVPFFILSGGYGLIEGNEVIEPYNAVMTKDKCKGFKEEIKKKLKNFDIVIYYRGGARREYLDCILEVISELNKKFVVFGFKNMGDIGKLEEIVNHERSE